jgi:hypothetical protein
MLTYFTSVDSQPVRRVAGRTAVATLEHALQRAIIAVYHYFHPPHPFGQPDGMHYPERVWRRHSAYLMQLHRLDP